MRIPFAIAHPIKFAHCCRIQYRHLRDVVGAPLWYALFWTIPITAKTWPEIN